MSNGQNEQQAADLSPSDTQKAVLGLGGPAAGLLLGALLGGKKHRTSGAVLGTLLGAGGAYAALQGIQRKNLENYVLAETIRALPHHIRRKGGMSPSADLLGRKAKMKGLKESLGLFRTEPGEALSLPAAPLPNVVTGKTLLDRWLESQQE